MTFWNFVEFSILLFYGDVVSYTVVSVPASTCRTCEWKVFEILVVDKLQEYSSVWQFILELFWHFTFTFNVIGFIECTVILADVMFLTARKRNDIQWPFYRRMNDKVEPVYDFVSVYWVIDKVYPECAMMAYLMLHHNVKQTAGNIPVAEVVLVRAYTASKRHRLVRVDKLLLT